MQLNTYLFFDGQCEAAFKFYEKHLGGKIETMMTHAGTPMADQVPPEWRDKIIHARMTVADTVLMASDPPPGRYSRPQGFSVTLNVPDFAEAKRLFDVLAEGGEINMPFAETFFAAGFGMLNDQFGIPWMVNCEKSS